MSRDRCERCPELRHHHLHKPQVRALRQVVRAASERFDVFEWVPPESSGSNGAIFEGAGHSIASCSVHLA